MFNGKSSGKILPSSRLSARALNASNAAAQNAAAAARDYAQSAAESGQQAAQAASENVAPLAQSAAENISSASRTAAEEVGRSVRQGVTTAREWAAPRLETAADYWADSAAPKVTDALRTTAKRVEPEKGRWSVLKVILLSIAGVAGAGAVGLLVQRQLSKSAARKEESDAMEAASVPPATVPGQTPASPAGI